MKKIPVLLVIFIFTAVTTLYAQPNIPREYIPPSGNISLSGSMPFNNVIQALSEISSRLERKVIIDEKIRTQPINVDIVDLSWRDALDVIVKVNNLTYEEFPTYIKIVEKKEVAEKVEAKEFNSSMREVNISAIFFEGDKQALLERGINWEAVIQSGDVLTEVSQNLVGEKSTNDIFSAGVTVETPDATVTGLLKALETESVGEVLASPNIQVIEGEEGRIQVGQDFSIKQVDFAGNVTDNFISSGIILIVKPLVIQEDSITFIHLSAEVERSSVTPGQLTTIINKTSGNTALFLLDGERAVIAGLYSTTENISRSGIPILKDLPGWFFGIRYLTGFDRKERTEKELVIILKAELLPSLKEREISQSKAIEFLDRKREELKKRYLRDSEINNLKPEEMKK